MAREEKIKTDLGQRLRSIRQKFGDPERDLFCLRLGISKGSLGNYERGDRVPDSTVLQAYRALGVDVNWIVTGEGDMFDDPSKAPSAPITVEQTDFRQLVDAVGIMVERLEPPPPPPATIKFFPQAASAGWGRAVLEDEHMEELDMEAFASRLLGLDVDHITLFPVKGDSMYDTLKDGDCAVIDTSRPGVNADPEDGHIYVVSINGELYAKRADWSSQDHYFVWCSDNDLPQYAPIPLAEEEMDRARIIGEVLHVIRPVSNRRRRS